MMKRVFSNIFQDGKRGYVKPLVMDSLSFLVDDILVGSIIDSVDYVESFGQVHNEFDFTNEDTPFNITWEE